MQHYDIVRWLDFVRGVCAKADRRAMERHLSSPCRECAAKVAVLRRIMKATLADARLEVPKYAVDLARAVFPLRLPEIVAPGCKGKLVYDSFRARPAVRDTE